MAHWIIEERNVFGGQTYRCSECGYYFNDLFYEADDVCPECEVHMTEEPQKDQPQKDQPQKIEEKIVKKFVEYLKEHACNYDFSRDLSNCSYHSFRGIDTDDLDDMAEEFLKTI